MTYSSFRKRLVNYHQSVEISNAATRSCNMFARQIDLFLLIIVLDWTEQLNLCANTFSLANVSRIFSHFLQSMAITESELRKLRNDQWDERSDECKLQWREDAKRWWDERSDEEKLRCSEDRKRWWDNGQTRASCSAARMRRDGGTIGLTSTSRCGARMRKNDNMTYENFLPGQQKKQHITLSMEQMRMVHISSSLKYLVPMT